MRISDWSSDVCSSDLLRESEERYRLASHATNDVIWDWSHRTDRIEWGNGAVSEQHHEEHPTVQHGNAGQIGRASCRERVCQYVSISVVAVSLKKKNNIN